MLKMIANLDNSMGNASDFFNKLEPAIKAQIICSFVSSLGTDLAIVFLTFGAGTPKLLLTFLNYLKQFSRLEKILEYAQKTGEFAQIIPKQFLDKLAKNEISEKILERIENFSKNNMNELAGASIRCAL
jgi:hypothetical protein